MFEGLDIMDVPIHIALANLSVINKEWYGMWQKRAIENEAILSAALKWPFASDWIFANGLDLSKATHIITSSFYKLHTNNWQDVDLLFSDRLCLFNVDTDLDRIDQTVDLLIYLRHAYPEEIMACLFYVLFKYVLIADVCSLIPAETRMKVAMQLQMAQSCFDPILPLPIEIEYSSTLQKLQRVL